MIRAERIELIKSLAKERDIVTWEELQKQLHVSKATVQRDAELLCQASVLRKTRGGIIFIQEPDARELPYTTRQTSQIEAKRRIAEAALPFVQPGTFMMMDSGSSVRELARQIPEDIPFTAITYELDTALLLDSKPSAEVYLAGGKLRKSFMACHGFFAEEMLRQFRASVCFLGADAVSASSGVTEHNMYDVPLKQIMIQNSDKVVLLADHTKFATNAYIHVATLEQIDVLITDAEPDEATMQEMDRMNVRVITVPMD